MNIKVFLLMILLLAGLFAFGQKTMLYNEPDDRYAGAVQLYEAGHYGAAQKIFEEFASSDKPENSVYKDDAKYYASMCALKLFNKDAEYLISVFIREHPESYNVNDANFQMGNYQFLKKKYPSALKWYEEVDRLSLTAEENGEYFFKTGYCHFARKDYDKAANAFYEIKDGSTFYAPIAEYFYSHIKYMNQQYQTALLGFKKLENNELFADIIPYYITQIYYMQSKYEEIIAYAPDVLKKSNGERMFEVARIIGEAYYRTGKYNDALEYLEMSHPENASLSDMDAYQLAFAYYKTQNYAKAIPLFESVVNVDDTLSQNAAYHLADCYIKTNRKKDAKLAFGAASKLSYNQTIREDALFNFAKISFDLDMSPFNEALNAFTTYLNEFPQSPRVDEVYDYMLQAFATTKNYQDALGIMDKMKNRPPKIDQEYQRIAFLRGQECFIDSKFEKAIGFFDKSLQFKQYDPVVKAQSYYWKAEAYYRMERYNESIEIYKTFVESSGAVNLDEFATAHYNIGYAYFVQKDYTNAGNWFRKFEKQYEGGNEKLYNDALNRIGDCYYISKQFEPATEYYKKSAQLGKYDSDYAMYQMALGYGGQKQHQEKVWSLTRLVREYPNSNYSGFANFEIARTYSTMLNKPDSAIFYYNKVISDYSGTPMIKPALSDLATLYFDLKRYNEALESYKQLIALYPNSDEARTAKDMIRTIYIAMNDTDGYVEYANTPGSNLVVTVTEQDSLTFLAAQKLYVNQEYERALEAIEKYISKFPQGAYLTEAHYYRAELLYYFKRSDEALPSYEIVATAPIGMYTEESVLKAASINYLNKKYDKALPYYVKLDNISKSKNNILTARLGQLRCNYILGKWDDVITSAKNLTETENAGEDLIKEARYDEAKARYNLQQWVQAYNLFSAISTEVNSYEGAEARFRMAEIQLKIGRDTLAENMIYEFAQMSSPHRYWLAKSFILLADIFLSRNDVFQAKHTLQSVLDNYTDDTDGIKDEAFTKLAEINEKEKADEQSNDFLKMEIDLGGSDDGYEKLIEPEKTENEKPENNNQ
ncbi:MAG TPA: tetratricopeptide repeat protein [Bacteroidales bacterium]|nr:tetratricopeptide repeat protein [Bacteroidales bacterium]